jgi:hypothetical protein
LSIFASHGRRTDPAPTIEQQLRAAATAPENVADLDRFLASAAPARTKDERRGLFGELVSAVGMARIPGGGRAALDRERAERNISTILAELLDGSQWSRRVA